MSQDETRGLNKNLDFMRAISILFLVMNVYYFCYPYFLSMNLNIGVVDKILLNFQRDTGLFSHSLVRVFIGNQPALLHEALVLVVKDVIHELVLQQAADPGSGGKQADISGSYGSYMPSSITISASR